MAIQNSFGNVLYNPKMANASQGDIFYVNSSGVLTSLGIGSPGQMLMATATIPGWSNFAPTFTGDLSGTLPNGVINNTAVTFPKIQNVATTVILGRATAGTGSIEALTPSQIQTMLGLGAAAYLATGIAAGNIPVLDSNGVLNTAVIPPLALNTIQVVANSAARLALSNVQPGDAAKQSDTGVTYLLAAVPASTDANWVQIGDTLIDASDVTTGVFSTDRLALSGTANSSSYLRGDRTWATITGGGGLTWSDVSGTSQATAVSNGYFASNASTRITFTLPATAALGSIIRIVGNAAAGWRVGQNAGQQIKYLGQSSTVGTSGYIEAEVTQTGSALACVELICSVANTTFIVAHSVGTLTVV